MTPVVSPGKTWEGFTAGAIAGVFTTFLALYKEDDPASQQRLQDLRRRLADAQERLDGLWRG